MAHTFLLEIICSLQNSLREKAFVLHVNPNPIVAATQESTFPTDVKLQHHEPLPIRAPAVLSR